MVENEQGRSKKSVLHKVFLRNEEDKSAEAVDPSSLIDLDDDLEPAVEVRPQGEVSKSEDPERRQDDGSAPDVARVFRPAKAG